MTKKDYIAFAKVLHEYDPEYIKDLVEDLCILFKQDNPSFNKNKFKEACGL